MNIFRRLGILKRRFQYTPDIVQRLGDWRPCEVPPIGWPKIIIFILAGNPEPDDKFSCFSVSVNKGGGALFRARHLVKRFWESPPRDAATYSSPKIGHAAGDLLGGGHNFFIFYS